MSKHFVFKYYTHINKIVLWYLNLLSSIPTVYDTDTYKKNTNEYQAGEAAAGCQFYINTV